MVGNFPPHEAFAIGGTNSVRGYEEGAVGSGRSYVVGCGEISFPLVVSFLSSHTLFLTFLFTSPLKPSLVMSFGVACVYAVIIC